MLSVNHFRWLLLPLFVWMLQRSIVHSQRVDENDPILSPTSIRSNNVSLSDMVSYESSITHKGTTQSRNTQEICRNIGAFYYQLPDSVTSMPNYKNLFPFYNDTVEEINFNGFSPLGGSGLSISVGAVFQARLKFPMKGNWTLCMYSDNGSNLFINNKLVASVEYVPERQCGNYVAKTNQIVNVKIEFFQEAGPFYLYFSWSLINSEYSLDVTVPSCTFLKYKEPTSRLQECSIHGFIKIRCCGILGRVLHKCKK
jgi:hypothetical protein